MIGGDPTVGEMSGVGPVVLVFGEVLLEVASERGHLRYQRKRERWPPAFL
jgi:hypothetical protein